jgi:hypothetical protein
MLGLARVAVRLKDGAVACASYRSLVADWEHRRDARPIAAGAASTSAEISEARAYVAASCAPAAAAPAPRP